MRIVQGQGDDDIVGTNSSDEILADSIPLDDQGGDDTVRALAGDDTVRGFGGDNYINGGLGNDTLITADGRDQIYGGGGADDVQSGRGADVVHGGAGNDALHGGEGDDLLYGEAGADRVIGSSDNDTLYGGVGSDNSKAATARTRSPGVPPTKARIPSSTSLWVRTTSDWAVSSRASMAARRSSSASSGSCRTVAGRPVCSRLMPMVRPAAAGATSLWPKVPATFMPFRSTKSAIC